MTDIQVNKQGGELSYIVAIYDAAGSNVDKRLNQQLPRVCFGDVLFVKTTVPQNQCTTLLSSLISDCCVR